MEVSAFHALQPGALISQPQGLSRWLAAHGSTARNVARVAGSGAAKSGQVLHELKGHKSLKGPLAVTSRSKDGKAKDMALSGALYALAAQEMAAHQ